MVSIAKGEKGGKTITAPDRIPESVPTPKRKKVTPSDVNAKEILERERKRKAEEREKRRKELKENLKELRQDLQEERRKLVAVPGDLEGEARSIFKRSQRERIRNLQNLIRKRRKQIAGQPAEAQLIRSRFKQAEDVREARQSIRETRKENIERIRRGRKPRRISAGGVTTTGLTQEEIRQLKSRRRARAERTRQPAKRLEGKKAKQVAEGPSDAQARALASKVQTRVLLQRAKRGDKAAERALQLKTKEEIDVDRIDRVVRDRDTGQEVLVGPPKPSEGRFTPVERGGERTGIFVERRTGERFVQTSTGELVREKDFEATKQRAIESFRQKQFQAEETPVQKAVARGFAAGAGAAETAIGVATQPIRGLIEGRTSPEGRGEIDVATLQGTRAPEGPRLGEVFAEEKRRDVKSSSKSGLKRQEFVEQAARDAGASSLEQLPPGVQRDIKRLAFQVGRKGEEALLPGSSPELRAKARALKQARAEAVREEVGPLIDVGTVFIGGGAAGVARGAASKAPRITRTLPKSLVTQITRRRGSPEFPLSPGQGVRAPQREGRFARRQPTQTAADIESVVVSDPAGTVGTFGGRAVAKQGRARTEFIVQQGEFAAKPASGTAGDIQVGRALTGFEDLGGAGRRTRRVFPDELRSTTAGRAVLRRIVRGRKAASGEPARISRLSRPIEVEQVGEELVFTDPVSGQTFSLSKSAVQAGGRRSTARGAARDVLERKPPPEALGTTEFRPVAADRVPGGVQRPRTPTQPPSISPEKEIVVGGRRFRGVPTRDVVGIGAGTSRQRFAEAIRTEEGSLKLFRREQAPGVEGGVAEKPVPIATIRQPVAPKTPSRVESLGLDRVRTRVLSPTARPDRVVDIGDVRGPSRSATLQEAQTLAAAKGGIPLDIAREGVRRSLTGLQRRRKPRVRRGVKIDRRLSFDQAVRAGPRFETARVALPAAPVAGQVVRPPADQFQRGDRVRRIAPSARRVRTRQGRRVRAVERTTPAAATGTALTGGRQPADRLRPEERVSLGRAARPVTGTRVRQTRQPAERQRQTQRQRLALVTRTGRPGRPPGQPIARRVPGRTRTPRRRPPPLPPLPDLRQSGGRRGGRLGFFDVEKFKRTTPPGTVLRGRLGADEEERRRRGRRAPLAVRSARLGQRLGGQADAAPGLQLTQAPRRPRRRVVQKGFELRV